MQWHDDGFVGAHIQLHLRKPTPGMHVLKYIGAWPCSAMTHMPQLGFVEHFLSFSEFSRPTEGWKTLLFFGLQTMYKLLPFSISNASIKQLHEAVGIRERFPATIPFVSQNI